MAKRHTAHQHDRLVQYVARQLKRRFYDDIRARSHGFQPPAPVTCDEEGAACVPDVTMVAKKSHLHVLEVETPETLQHTDTNRKWQTLAQHAQEMGGTFWVVVPKSAREGAMNKLRSLNLSARVWEVEPEYA